MRSDRVNDSLNKDLSAASDGVENTVTLLAESPKLDIWAECTFLDWQS